MLRGWVLGACALVGCGEGLRFADPPGPILVGASFDLEARGGSRIDCDRNLNCRSIGLRLTRMEFEPTGVFEVRDPSRLTALRAVGAGVTTLRGEGSRGEESVSSEVELEAAAASRYELSLLDGLRVDRFRVAPGSELLLVWSAFDGGGRRLYGGGVVPVLDPAGLVELSVDEGQRVRARFAAQLGQTTLQDPAGGRLADVEVVERPRPETIELEVPAARGAFLEARVVGRAGEAVVATAEVESVVTSLTPEVCGPDPQTIPLGVPASLPVVSPGLCRLRATATLPEGDVLTAEVSARVAPVIQRVRED